MLPTEFVWFLTSRYLILLLIQQDMVFNFNFIFKSLSNFFCLDLKITISVFANRIKKSINSQKLGSRNFGRIANSVLNKGKSAVLPILNGLKMLSSTSDKVKLFAKNFSKNSNLDDSGISYLFSLLELIWNYIITL